MELKDKIREIVIVAHNYRGESDCVVGVCTDRIMKVIEAEKGKENNAE